MSEIINLFFRYWKAFIIPMSTNVVFIRILIAKYITGEFIHPYGIFMGQVILVYDIIVALYFIILYVIMRMSDDFKTGVDCYNEMVNMNQLTEVSIKRHQYKQLIEANKKSFKIWCFKNGYEHAKKMNMKKDEKNNPYDKRMDESIARIRN